MFNNLQDYLACQAVLIKSLKDIFYIADHIWDSLCDLDL